MKKELIITSLVGVLLLTTPYLLHPILAQSPSPTVEPALTAFEFTAIPPRVEISAKPGTTIQKTLKLKNTTGATQFFSTNVEDFIIDTDGKTPIPVNETLSDRFSLARWITISPTRFSLPNTQTQVLDLVIQIPQDALPGGHYAMVLHAKETGTSQATETLLPESSTGISPRVGTLVYLTVEGPINEEAFIRNVKAPNLVENGPVPISFDIENRSDVHIRPQTTLEVTDVFGRKIFSSLIEGKNIFPFTTRDFQGSFDQVWGIGPYHATLAASFGTQGQVIRASTNFWVFPYRLIATIFVVLLSAISIMILIRRHLHHRGDMKTKEIETLKKRVEELEQENEEKD